MKMPRKVVQRVEGALQSMIREKWEEYCPDILARLRRQETVRMSEAGEPPAFGAYRGLVAALGLPPLVQCNSCEGWFEPEILDCGDCADCNREIREEAEASVKNQDPIDARETSGRWLTGGSALV